MILALKKAQNQIKITQKMISNQNQNNCHKSDFKSKSKIIKMISNHDFKSNDFKSFPTLQFTYANGRMGKARSFCTGNRVWFALWLYNFFSNYKIEWSWQW